MNFLGKYLIGLFCIMNILSCTHDDVIQSQSANHVVSINFMLCAESNDCMTRAISDGKNINELYYAIFNESGEVVIPKTTKQNVSGITSNGLIMTITLPAGLNYKAVFWVQNSESEAYSVSDDMKVSVDYTKTCNNDESDAFYGVSNVFSTSDDFVEVILRRPFAQLNVGAFPFDMEYIKNSHEFNITKSCMLVHNVAHNINLFTGELSEIKNASFKPNVLPKENLIADIDENGISEEYTYVAMAYLLAETKPTTHTAEFFFLNDKGEAVLFENDVLNSVQLQRNYRTDYIGQVLTDNGYINVRIYDNDGNTENENVYYNVSEATTIENLIYNMSSHNTALQFASENGQTITYNNMLFTGDIWTIELGEYRGSSYVNYNNILNNVELRNLSVSSCIECHEWYFSPAAIAYGNSEFNNCIMTGTTTIRKTVTDKHGEVHEVIPVDIGIRNESDAVFNGGVYGIMFAWTHAVVSLYNVIIDTLYCGTCDSTNHSWMTIGAGTTIDKIICCEPRCPYGTKEYSTTMTIKKGAKVGSLQLVSTDVEFLIIEDGAYVGTITCDGIEYTYDELRTAMGL